MKFDDGLQLANNSNSTSARVRVRFFKINMLLTAVNLIVRALNTIYFKNVSINFTDANQKCFEYIDIRNLQNNNGTCSSSRYYTLNLLYRRVYFCFGSLSGVRRKVVLKYYGSCNDRTKLQFILSISRLAVELELPLNLQSNQFVKKHIKFHKKKNNYQQLNQSHFPFESAFYTTVGETGAIELVSDLVSLPAVGDAVSNIQLSSVLPSVIAGYYSNISSLLLNEKCDQSKFKRPSVMVKDHNEYVKLIKRLHQLNMVTFTSSPKSVLGAFGVPKDENSIRLIIDATNTNALMVPPPKVFLPNASHLSNIHSTSPFFISKLDLSNYYHQLRLPNQLQSYFCLPALNQIDLQSFSIDSTTLTINSNKYYPMLTTLPMGWSHSVFIAQSVHEHIVYNMNRALSPLNNALVNSVLITYLHIIYIDDFAILAYNEQVMNELVEKVKLAYASVGLKINTKKCVSTTMELVKVIGITIIGRQQRIIVATDDLLVSLVHRTITLLDQLECTSNQLAILVGHWTWYILLKRSMLSILQRTYRFIQQFRHTAEVKVIWNSIKRELLLLCSLAPLIQVEMNIKVCSRIIATDASMSGYGIMSNNQYASSSQLTEQIFTLAQHVGLHGSNCASITFETNIDIINTIDQLTIPFTIHQPVITSTLMNRIRCDVEISSLVTSIRNSVDWITIMSGCWKFNDSSTHINELELHSVLLAVRWLVSLVSIRSRNRKVVILVDNSVSIYSLRKGRSSSMSLLSIIRRISVLLLSMDVVLKVVYIKSNLNPADAASRLYC